MYFDTNEASDSGDKEASPKEDASNEWVNDSFSTVTFLDDDDKIVISSVGSVGWGIDLFMF